MKTLSLVSMVSLVMFMSSAKADDDAPLAYMALNNSPVSLSSLIDTATAQYSGFAFEAELDDYKDKVYGYEITLVDPKAKQVRELFYSLESGALINERSHRLELLGISTVDEDERAAIAHLNASNTSVSTLINALETSHNARVLEFELAHQMGISYYEVELYSAEKGHHHLLINADNGQAIPLMKQP